MPQDSKSTTKAAANDFEALSEQMAALREDLAQLAQTVGGIAGRRGGTMAADFSEGMAEAKRYVETTGKSAEAQLQDSVSAHPFLAIALAAGAGLVVGAMARR